MSSVTLSHRTLRTPAAKRILLGLAILRAILGIIAIPLAPFLYKEHFVVLVLLRPTKEVFLAGGFLARQGDVSLLVLVLAAIPLSILGVWFFYVLGRAYSREINAERLPALAARVLTPDRVKRVERALKKKGPKLILLGRMALFSSATIAAAAGAAKLEPKKFFPYDLLGGLLSIAYTIGAGWALGAAYDRAGPWLTVAGVVALIGFAFVLGRSLADGDD